MRDVDGLPVVSVELVSRFYLLFDIVVILALNEDVFAGNPVHLKFFVLGPGLFNIVESDARI